MSVETFVPSTKLITLTDSAVKHFESKLKDKPGQLIRLSTKVSGCTGYAYVLDFADSAQADDEIIELQAKITYYEVIIKYIDGIIKSIDNRGWDIRNAQDWKKFEAGML